MVELGPPRRTQPANQSQRLQSVLRIRISLDPFHFDQPDPDAVHKTSPGSKKSAIIMKNFHKNQPKILNLCLRDINIYLINITTDNVLEKNILNSKKSFFKRSWYVLDIRSDSEQDPNPLFHEMYPRIRIHIKMKRIRNIG